MLGVFAEVASFHWYAAKAPASNTVFEPAQKEAEPEMVGVKSGLMVTSWQSSPVQPLASVTVTQYCTSVVGASVMVCVVEPSSHE